MRAVDGATTAVRSRAARQPLPTGVVAALWVLVVLLPTPLAAAADRVIVDLGRPDLQQFAAGPLLLYVVAVSVGSVLATRRPRHPVGWLLIAVGGGLIVVWAASIYLTLAMLLDRALPLTRVVAVWYPAGATTVLVLVAFVLLLTPTGALPSPRWRGAARAVVASWVVLVVAATVAPGPVDVRSMVDGGPFEFGGMGGAVRVVCQAMPVVAMLTVVGAGWSLVLRFRRAEGIERQQLRWVALIAWLSPLAGAAILAGVRAGSPELIGNVLLALAAAIILAIGAATLRYRLYDVDVIVRRTVVYGVLTVLLGGGYALVVLGVGQLVGSPSDLVVAAATLAVAATFQPARRRVQRAVDRRFNRTQYDAVETVHAFSAELREHVDLPMLVAQLGAVIQHTLEPSHLSLQLRPGVGPAQRGRRSTSSR